MKSVMSWAAFGMFTSLSVQAANVTIEHQMGKTTVEQNPQRVVVIGIGPLDAVHYFGINPVAVSKVAELPEYLAQYKGADYAPAGSLFEPDFERIYTQKPDVIITGPRAARTAYDELSKIAPTVVFAIDDKKPYWESTQAQWRNLVPFPFNSDRLSYQSNGSSFTSITTLILRLTPASFVINPRSSSFNNI